MQQEQNKAPFVAGPQPVPTKGLGEAPRDPRGPWGAHGGTAPRQLWEQRGAQDVWLKSDDKELLWLFQIAFSQGKPARLNESTSCFIASVGASRITKQYVCIKGVWDAEKATVRRLNPSAGEGVRGRHAQAWGCAAGWEVGDTVAGKCS